MKPSRSAKEFNNFVKSSGKTLSDISATDAVELMLAFYKKFRANNCSIDHNGDMLLYQWGIYDWGKGETFNFNLTRQFIFDGSSGDEGISQLSLTIHFAPTENFRKFEDGNRWCERLPELDNFKKFILNSEAYNTTRNLKPLRVEIIWNDI